MRAGKNSFPVVVMVTSWPIFTVFAFSDHDSDSYIYFFLTCSHKFGCYTFMCAYEFVSMTAAALFWLRARSVFSQTLLGLLSSSSCPSASQLRSLCAGADGRSSPSITPNTVPLRSDRSLIQQDE